jgi:hypothetical protein
MSEELAERGKELEGKLAGYPGPAYLKTYLARLLASGIGFAVSGDGRAAAYCFDKVEQGLEAAVSVSAAAAAEAPKPQDEPLARLRQRWRGEAVRSAEAVLAKHGRRLAPLELKSFRDRLEKAKAFSEGPGSEAGSERALPDLRRRLYARVLKSQKAGITGRSQRGGFGRGLLSELSAEPSFAGPVGPYNDRFNLQGLLEAVAGADPAWVEEFLDLYRDLAGLKGLAAAAAAIKKT